MASESWDTKCPACGLLHTLKRADLGVGLNCAGCGVGFKFDEPIREERAIERKRKLAEAAARDEAKRAAKEAKRSARESKNRNKNAGQSSQNAESADRESTRYLDGRGESFETIATFSTIIITLSILDIIIGVVIAGNDLLSGIIVIGAGFNGLIIASVLHCMVRIAYAVTRCAVYLQRITHPETRDVKLESISTPPD